MKILINEKIKRNIKVIAMAVAIIMSVGYAAESAWAKTAKEIDACVNACLNRFHKQVAGAKEVAAKCQVHQNGT